MYINAGRSLEEAQKHADSLIFSRELYLSNVARFDSTFESRKRINEIMNNLRETNERMESSLASYRQSSDDSQINEVKQHIAQQSHVEEHAETSEPNIE